MSRRLYRQHTRTEIVHSFGLRAEGIPDCGAPVGEGVLSEPFNTLPIKARFCRRCAKALEHGIPENPRWRGHRGRHRSAPRPKTMPSRMTKAEQRAAEAEPSNSAPSRPMVRGDCIAGPRPCPWVGCRYHLYIDVNPRLGSIKLNWPNLEPWELLETCALDAADRGTLILEDCGDRLNITRERVRQLEAKALAKLRGRRETERLRAHVED